MHQQTHIAKLAERVDWETWWPLRRHARQTVAFPIVVKETTAGALQSILGQCVDFSDGGVGTQLTAGLQPGEIVTLELAPPSSRTRIVMPARVRHCEGTRIGFEFLGPASTHIARLKRLCHVTAEEASPF